MAKGYSDKNLNKIIEMKDPTSVKERKFINSRGLELKLIALSPYMVQLAMESVEKPKPPFYYSKTESGDEVKFIHDEKSILDPKTTDAEKDEWRTYLEQSAEAEKRSADIMVNVILIEAVELEITDVDRWIKRQKLMGITVPEDPDERLLLYKKEYAIGSADDMEQITRIVLSLTGISKEDVDLAKKSFQSPVESEPQEGSGSSS